MSMGTRRTKEIEDELAYREEEYRRVVVGGGFCLGMARAGWTAFFVAILT